MRCEACALISVSIASKILGSSPRPDCLADVRGELDVERLRAPTDRRSGHPLWADWRWSLRGRRKAVRRATDESRAFLDWYHPGLLFVIVTTYVLSGIDAILTLTLLEMGVATEANPIMHMLLAEDVRLFAGVKALITGVGLVLLAAYSNQCIFTFLRVDRVLYALFAIYSLLVYYEIRMLMYAESVGWPS